MALPEFELQQELQRFTTQFTERVTQATEILEAPERAPWIRDAALRKALLYISSALEIATGPFVEINLLDMIVLIRLSRAVLERYWIPDVYGDAGAELGEVFAKSERELAELATHALSAEQRQQVIRIIDDWMQENPNQRRVEGIRLADFSEAAGSVASERAAQAKGLLASVKTATRAANQALLLSERGLFLVHRLPFMWRLQARLGAREMLGDTVMQLTTGREAPLARMGARARQLAGRLLVGLGIFGGAGVGLWWLRSRLLRR